MLYFGLYVQLRRGSVAGYTTDESWAYGPKEGVEAFESITFFIRFIYAINFEHLLINTARFYALWCAYRLRIWGLLNFWSIIKGGRPWWSPAFLMGFIYYLFLMSGGRGTEPPSYLNNLCLSLHHFSSSNNVDALGHWRQWAVVRQLLSAQCIDGIISVGSLFVHKGVDARAHKSAHLKGLGL